MHPSLCWLIIHARLINAAQKTEWDQNNGCTWAFLLSLPSPTWLPPAGISAMGRDDSWNRARANVQAATSRRNKTGKSGATSHHILFVCVCVQLWGERCILHSRRFFAGVAACLDLAGILCLSLPVWVEKPTAEKETGVWVCVHVGGGMLTFRWRLDQEEVEGGGGWMTWGVANTCLNMNEVKHRG